MTIGQYIKENRIANNMTQEEVAEELGINFQNIWNMENDRIPFPSKHVKKLAALFKVDALTMSILALESTSAFKKFKHTSKGGEIV